MACTNYATTCLYSCQATAPIIGITPHPPSNFVFSNNNKENVNGGLSMHLLLWRSDLLPLVVHGKSRKEHLHAGRKRGQLG